MLYRVIAGRFVHNGHTYCKNDIVETSMDLIAMFGDLKFKREIELEIAKESTSVQFPSPKNESSLGEDITARYKLAKENNLRVFKDEKDFFVAKEDSVGEALNDNPLKRSEVVGFIEALIKKE